MLVPSSFLILVIAVSTVVALLVSDYYFRWLDRGSGQKSFLKRQKKHFFDSGKRL
jgi:hypothetical protein